MIAAYHTMNHELDIVFKVQDEVTIWPYPNGSHSGTCAPIVISVPVFVERVFLLPTFEQEHVCTILKLVIVSEEIKRARIVVVIESLNHIAHSVICRVSIVVFISMFHN